MQNIMRRKELCIGESSHVNIKKETRSWWLPKRLRSEPTSPSDLNFIRK